MCRVCAVLRAGPKCAWRVRCAGRTLGEKGDGRLVGVNWWVHSAGRAQDPGLREQTSVAS